MAFKNRLLATAAIPLVALIGLGPVSAAEFMRPTVPAEAQLPVVKVQSSDDQEQLKKRERKERRQQEQQNQNSEQNDQNQKRKNRQDQNAGQQQQDNNSQRRSTQNNDADMQQQDQSQQPRRKKHEQSQDNAVQTIDNGDQQEQVKPRHKKNNDNAETQQTTDQSQQSGQQEQVKPRHKKNNDNAETQQNGDQGQQTDQQDQVKPRHKKNSENAETQQNTDQGQQTDQQDQVKPRHKKNSDNAETQQNGDQSQQTDQQDQVKPRHKKNSDNAETQQNTDQGQQNDQDQVKPRHKKDQNAETGQQNDNNASSDQGQSENDKLKNAIERSNKKHRKNQDQDQADQPTDNSGSSIERIQTKKKDQQQNDENAASDENNKPRKNAQPVDVKKAKDIAADPAKTTDTVVLPVDNGAAVLDSDKDADNRGADRNRRKQLREENKNVQAPKSDKDAQRGFKSDEEVRIRPVLQEKGERIPGFKGYDDAGGRRVDDRSNRVVINIGGRLVIRGDDDRRLARDRDIRYDRLPNNQIREVIVMPNGDRIVTVRNRWGEIIRRSRIINNREVVIFYSPDLERGRDRLFLRDPGEDLPPMRLTIPLRDYIIDVSGQGGGSRDYEEFLDEPPVERVERVYSVDEVKNSARIRDKMRRIDLDTITFDTGSSEIAEDQVQTLKKVGDAIKAIIDKDPGETFLIEGHTDAVGSDESNLVLSDSRAEAVANVLSDAFDIPAENLTTQGYGERYLKVNTDGPERLNRRVTIRRITPLVRPANAEADAE